MHYTKVIGGYHIFFQAFGLRLNLTPDNVSFIIIYLVCLATTLGETLLAPCVLKLKGMHLYKETFCIAR